MSSLQFSLASRLVACAAALALTGCHAPWSLPDQELDVAEAASSTTSISPTAGSTPRAGSTASTPTPPPPPTLPTEMPAAAPLVPQATTEPDLIGVVDKLQQVAEMDPAAQQALLHQLRQTDPKFWPAVAEQFRASLAYHYELEATSPQIQRTADAVSWPSGLPRVSIAPPHSNVAPATSSIPSPASLPMSPSTPIGSLPDPRRAEADGISSEALALATPYSHSLAPHPQTIPSHQANAPASFEADQQVYPIDPPRQLSKSDRLPPVIKSAAYEVVVPPNAAVEADSAAKKDWQQLVAEAAVDLSHRVSDSPSTTAEIHQHVSLRILRLLAGQTEEALQPIPHISPIEQDYWSRQIFALATYLDHHSQSDDKRRAAASATHLDEAIAHLRDLGALSLRNFTFCKNIYGYGAVEAYQEDRFSPGQQVSLYVEVENYHSQSTEKGFTTSLGSTYEILDERGQRVDGGEFPDVDDCCRSRRRDFHIQLGVTLPDKIAPGRYQFQLVVRDRQSDKIAHATAAFEIQGNITPLAK